MIYFITCRDAGRVKIGYSHDPEKRLAQFRANQPPGELVLEAVIDGDLSFERELHQIFHSARCHGEWFKLSPPIEMAIHWIKSGEAIPNNAAAYLAPFLAQQYPRAAKVLEATA